MLYFSKPHLLTHYPTFQCRRGPILSSNYTTKTGYKQSQTLWDSRLGKNNFKIKFNLSTSLDIIYHHSKNVINIKHELIHISVFMQSLLHWRSFLSQCIHELPQYQVIARITYSVITWSVWSHEFSDSLNYQKTSEKTFEISYYKTNVNGIII